MALGWAPAAPARVSLLNGDGTERWSVEIPPVTGPWGRVLDLEIAPDGDVFASCQGMQTEQITGYAPNDNLFIARLDGATGALEWRSDLAQGNLAPRIELDGAGNLFSLECCRTLISQVVVMTLVRDSSSGTELWARDLVPPPDVRTVADFDVDPTGRSVVFMRGPSTLTPTRLFSVDGTGTLEWTSSDLSGLRAGALLEGGAYVIPGPTPSTPIQRVDPSGAFEALTLPEVGFVNEGIAALPGGGFLALSERDILVSPREWALAAHDAAGQELWRQELDSILPGIGAVQTIAVDARGNLLIGSSGMVLGGWAARTAEFVIGAAQGAGECAPTVPNSTGATSRLDAVGSDVAASNDLTLILSDLPSGQTILILNSEVAGVAPGAGGSQGTLCLGPGIGRFTQPGDIRTSDASGRATLRVDLSRVPRPSIFAASMAGDTWLFQGWHRDQNPGQTSNFTNAVRVVLQ